MNEIQPEDLVHLDEWTPEQQEIALKYQIAFFIFKVFKNLNFFYFLLPEKEEGNSTRC